MSGSTTTSPSLQADLTKVIDAINAATQALTESTHVLMDISAQIGPNGNVDASPVVEAPPATISTWEDDPFSEAVPTPNPAVSALTDQAVTAPSANVALSWQITGAQPVAGQHRPGTSEFRYWNVQESIAGSVGHFARLMPHGTRWSTIQSPLPGDPGGRRRSECQLHATLRSAVLSARRRQHTDLLR